MTDDRPQSAGADLALTVTISCEPGLVPTLEALTARIGEYVGCGSEASRQVAEAVASVLQSGCASDSAAAPSGEFDVRFQGNDHLLRVDLTRTAPLPGGTTLKDTFREPDGAARLNRLVDRVEFGETDDGCPSCRLTRQIRDAR